MSKLESILEGIIRRLGELTGRLERIEAVDISRTYRGTTSQRTNTALGYGNQALFWDTDEQQLYVWDDGDWVVVGNVSHTLATTSGLGATHTVSGLTARQVLIATGGSTALFRALEDADIPSSIARDSEVSSAVSSHAGDANAHHSRDHTLATTSGLGSTHVVSGLTNRQVLIATGSSTALFRILEDADIPSSIARDSEVSSLISSHAGDANAHHSRDHTLATTSGLGSTHVVSGLTNRQVLIATGSSTALFRALEDADIPSSIARDSEVSGAVSSHAVSSDHDSRYYQKSEFASTSGAAAKPLITSSSGLLAIEGLGVGASAVSNTITSGGGINATVDLRAGRGVVVGSTTSGSQTGVLMFKEIASGPIIGTGSGFGYLWYNTSKQLWFSDEDGTSTRLV